MAGIEFNVKIEGLDRARAFMRRINPGSNDSWVRRSLDASAFAVQQQAAEKELVAGGNMGGGRQLPVLPDRLTNRSGALKSSIRYNRKGSQYAAIGTDLNYGRAHELGFKGWIRVKSHKRTSAFGRKTKPFIVPAHARDMFLPPRPFLKPALTKMANSGFIARAFRDEWLAEIRNAGGS